MRGPLPEKSCDDAARVEERATRCVGLIVGGPVALRRRALAGCSRRIARDFSLRAQFLDSLRRAAYPCRLFAPARARLIRSRRHETYVSTQQGTPQADARFSRAHGNEKRAQGPGPTPGERPQASHSLSTPSAEIRSGRTTSAPANASATRRSSSMSTGAGSVTHKLSFRRPRAEIRAAVRAWASRSLRAAWAIRWRAIGSGASCARRFASASTSCRPSTSSSRPARPRATPAPPSCARTSHGCSSR